MANNAINTINVRGTIYDIHAKYAETAGNVQLIVIKDARHATKNEPATPASEDTMGKIYLIDLSDDAEQVGNYTEFITTTNSTGDTYIWEQIGTTNINLSGYIQKGIYETVKNGNHTHTVTGTTTIPTVTHTSTKLAATADIEYTNNVDFVKSYPGESKKLTTTTVTGAVSNGTAATATVEGQMLILGDVDVAKAATSATRVATGSVDSSDSYGDSILTGLGTATTGKAVTAIQDPTISLVTGTTGDVNIVSSITVDSTNADLNNGVTNTTGEHTHTIGLD